MLAFVAKEVFVHVGAKVIAVIKRGNARQSLASGSTSRGGFFGVRRPHRKNIFFEVFHGAHFFEMPRKVLFLITIPA